MDTNRSDHSASSVGSGPEASKLAGTLLGIAGLLFVMVAILRALDGEDISSAVALATVFGGVGLVFLSRARWAKGKE